MIDKLRENLKTSIKLRKEAKALLQYARELEKEAVRSLYVIVKPKRKEADDKS